MAVHWPGTDVNIACPLMRMGQDGMVFHRITVAERPVFDVTQVGNHSSSS
jgi:hypothetical protein